MKVRITLIQLFLLTASVAHSGATSAGALFVPTSQSRSVSGSAFAEDFSGPVSDSDSEQANGFDAFDAGASAQVKLDGALGAGGGTQQSSIQAYSIVADGSAFANAESYDFDSYADGSGYSRLSVSFTLTAQSDYSLTGSIAAFDNGFSLVNFRDDSLVIFGEFASGPAEDIPFDVSGTLPPGQYTLELEAEGNAFGDPFTFSYASAEYTVAFHIAGTGPGGEVPDGKDVPGGPPLELLRLPGGDVRLSWGRSCRGDDTDYVVYEGEIGDPDSLAPLTCTTQGARSHDANPSYDGSFFLVVPTDGITEGSYGNTSEDVERDQSLSACFAQTLGQPVCP